METNKYLDYFTKYLSVNLDNYKTAANYYKKLFEALPKNNNNLQFNNNSKLKEKTSLSDKFYTSDNNSTNNLSFKQMVDKYGEGVIKISNEDKDGNIHLRENNANYGSKTSNHKKASSYKNPDGTYMPSAFDIVPTAGHSFLDIKAVLSKPIWLNWLVNLGNWGVIDESTPQIRASHSWKSTGNHYHIGPDSIAVKPTQLAKKGTKLIPRNK